MQWVHILIGELFQKAQKYSTTGWMKKQCSEYILLTSTQPPLQMKRLSSVDSATATLDHIQHDNFIHYFSCCIVGSIKSSLTLDFEQRCKTI